MASMVHRLFLKKKDIISSLNYTCTRLYVYMSLCTCIITLTWCIQWELIVCTDICGE